MDIFTLFSNLLVFILHVTNAESFPPPLSKKEETEAIEKMAINGVATNVHYKPLPMMTAYKNLGFDIADYPNAYAQYVNEITLPLNTRLSDEDVAYVIEKVVNK